MKALGLAAALLLAAGGTASAGVIERACMKSDRPAANPTDRAVEGDDLACGLGAGNFEPQIGRRLCRVVDEDRVRIRIGRGAGR